MGKGGKGLRRNRNRRPAPEETGTVIEIYPDVPKPDRVRVGAKCYVIGEADEEFTVAEVHGRSVFLQDAGGYDRGAESFAKLRRHWPYED